MSPISKLSDCGHIKRSVRLWILVTLLLLFLSDDCFSKRRLHLLTISKSLAIYIRK